MRAALALPIIAFPARAGAVESGEVGFALFGYKERGLMKVTEPIAWAKARVAEHWDVQASAAVDIVTGASPQLVSNQSGRPVQSITGASVATGAIPGTRRSLDASGKRPLRSRVPSRARRTISPMPSGSRRATT